MDKVRPTAGLVGAEAGCLTHRRALNTKKERLARAKL